MLSLLVLLLLPGSAFCSVADSRPDNTWVTNGIVKSFVQSGNTIYIGGLFDRVGPRTGPGVEFALDGSQNAGLPEVSGGGGRIQAVVSDGSGGWFIGGLFTHVGGVARNNIAHIRADHSVDPAFDPNANGTVSVLAVSGSTVYVAGLFTSIGGQPRNRIAGVNTADGTATAFNPNADNSVLALVVSPSGSIIYAGGRFTNIGGQPRSSIAALNAADGTATSTFNPGATASPPNTNSTVSALAISGATLYVGGRFAVIGGLPRNNIAGLTLGGALDGTATSFDPNASNSGLAAAASVDAIAVSSSTVYAGGVFDRIGVQSRKNLAGLDPTSGAVTSFDPNPSANVLGLAVAVDGLTVYAAGGFTSIGGQPRNFVAALNAADGTATTFNPDPNNAVSAIGASASAVYVAGYFSSIGGVVRHSIAALNAIDGTATSFDPNASSLNGNGTVNALAVSGSTVYAGGYFNSVGGQARSNIAALNAADGTAVLTFDPNADSIVESLAISGQTLYVGGIFNVIGGLPRSYLAALNAGGPLDGIAIPTFNANADDEVKALAVSGPLLYVGGRFLNMGGQPRSRIAALNTADGAATSFDPNARGDGFNAAVSALAVSGSTVYVGGFFSSMNGQNRKNIAAVSAVDGTPTGFDPQASGTPFSDAVHAIAVSGSSVYVGGYFSSIGGQARNLIAELNPSDGSATSFDPGAAGGTAAFALAVASDGTLYVGGDFQTFELASQQGFAAFSNPPPNLPPTARLTANPTSGTAPLPVNFNAATSSDPDSSDSIASYSFDFGDGSATVTQAGATTSHTYTSAGTYNATVTITDNHGLQSTNTASVSIQVVLPNSSPTARLTANPTSGVAPLTVSFDASTSSDPDSGDSIASYTFNFGDGSAAVTQGGATVSHTYTSAGNYNATVTVTDSHGLSSASPASVNITVTAPPGNLPPATGAGVSPIGDNQVGSLSSLTLLVLSLLGVIGSGRRRRKYVAAGG